MPTIKDRVLVELALRNNTITTEKLEQGKAAQKELEDFGIPKFLGQILVEKSITPREIVQELIEEMNSLSIRCSGCGRPNALADADRHGNIKCKHCQELVDYPDERINEEDLTSSPQARKSGKSGKSGKSSKSTKRTEREPGGKKSNDSAAVGGCKTGAEARASRAMESVSQADLAPRREITKFKLEKFLGAGPAGKLYTAKEGNRACAVKVIDKRLCAEKQQFKRWMDFAQKVQDLPQSVTLKPFQLFREGSVTYISRPFMGDERSSVRAKLQSRTEPHLQPKEVLLSILRALATFHAVRIVHGNLKPENVILSEEGACLTDPGQHILYGSLPVNERLLRLWEGSRYVAPEVLHGGYPTRTSDVFSVGRIVEDLCSASGVSPAQSDDELANTLALMTTPDPTERFASAKEALRQLEGRGKDSTRKMTRVAKRRGRDKLRLAGVSLLVFAVMVIGYQSVTWYRFRAILASPSRAEELTEGMLSREIDGLKEWTLSGSARPADVEERWADLQLFFAGTPWEERVNEAAQDAVACLSETGAQNFREAVQSAQQEADRRNWVGAVKLLLRVEESIDASKEARDLRVRVLEGLLQDHQLVLVTRGPVGKGAAEGGRKPVGPFLADVSPFAQQGSDSQSPEVKISFKDAKKLAASQGKRLPTGAEWDRMAELLLDGTSGWAPPSSYDSEGLHSGIFEWVDGGFPDKLSRAGYGYCRGGDRPGVALTHPLRRKKNSGYPDVGVRFVRDL